MKMEYNRSEQEIRALKRENAAMHKELQVCSDIFLNADKKYKGSLAEVVHVEKSFYRFSFYFCSNIK